MTTTNSTDKKQYLVTDPCYFMEDDVYSTFIDTDDGEVDSSNPFVIGGFGTVLQSEQMGELNVKVGKNKEFMSDSGLICLVEVDGDIEITEHMGTAVTLKKEVAEKWFAKGHDIAAHDRW